VFLSACSKFDDLEMQLNNQVEISSVAVFNVVPKSQRLDISLDGIKLNASTDKLGYGKDLPFRNWPAGRHTVTVVSHSIEGKETHEEVINLVGGQFYSLFIHKGDKLGIVQSKDEIIKPGKGHAKIRIAHMSSDAPAFTIRGRNGKILYSSEVKYKDVTPFVNVELADLQLIGEAKNATNTPEISYNFTPKNQGIYTLLIRGYIGSTDQSDEFSVELIEHR
jgi:hypothetical protein